MKLAVMAMMAFLLISLPLMDVKAINGWITDIQITQVPLNNETMRIRVNADVRVEFNESGYYRIVVEYDNGTEVTSSFSYKVGIPHVRSTVPVSFNVPRTPGNYTYHLVLQAKEDDSNFWSIVATAILSFYVLPPLTQGMNATNTTTASQTTSAQNQTQTVITGAYVITKNVTLTKTETVTHNLTHTTTVTTTVAVTRYVERSRTVTVTKARAITIRETETVTAVKTTTVVGIPNKLSRSYIIPIVSIASIFAFLVALLLWRRR